MEAFMGDESQTAGVRPSNHAGRGELTVGQRIDRYEIRRRIGSGAMGVVYAAFDPELDREIAIKTLHADGASPTERDRLLREARAMAKLSHPNVVGALAGRGVRCSTCSRSPGQGSAQHTRLGWCIATSSPTTCWSALTVGSQLATSGWWAM
jgi:serine/threonine protein kinase